MPKMLAVRRILVFLLELRPGHRRPVRYGARLEEEVRDRTLASVEQRGALFFGCSNATYPIITTTFAHRVARIARL